MLGRTHYGRIRRVELEPLEIADSQCVPRCCQEQCRGWSSKSALDAPWATVTFTDSITFLTHSERPSPPPCRQLHSFDRCSLKSIISHGHSASELPRTSSRVRDDETCSLCIILRGRDLEGAKSLIVSASRDGIPVVRLGSPWRTLCPRACPFHFDRQYGGFLHFWKARGSREACGISRCGSVQAHELRPRVTVAARWCQRTPKLHPWDPEATPG